MACNLANGRTEPCKQYIGGIDEIYFFKWSEVDYKSMFNIATDDLTAREFLKIGAGSLTAYKYDLKGINSFESLSLIHI